ISLTLAASARDGAGNTANAGSVIVSVLDVVPPTIVLLSPPAGSVDVEPTTSVTVQFSEPIARSSVTSASLSLANGATPIAVNYTFGDSDRSVTMIPAQPLTLNRTFTIAATAAITDAAGNALSAPLSSIFKTKSPDTTPPRVSAIVPGNGAVNVPVGTDVEVTFTEPVARATVTSASFHVGINGVPVAGQLAFANNDALVRFVPDTPLPFD